MRKGAAVAFALATLLSGCSKFTAQTGVDIKEVNIDLAFGKAPSTNPSTQPLLPPDVPLELPPPNLPPPPVFQDTPILCPPVSAVGADKAASTSVSADSDFYNYMKTRQGTYLFDYVWNYANKPQVHRYGTKDLGELQLENDNYQGSTPGGFSFDMHDNVDPKVVLGFGSWGEDPTASTNGQGQADEQDHDGFFFNQIVVPRDVKNSEADAFRGQAQYFKLLDYPITEGQHFTYSQPDTGFKPGNQVADPVNGGFLPMPAQGTLTITSDVGAKQIIAVCDKLAQAWEVNIHITAQENGPYSFDLVGKFWLATGYGGMPVREDFTISGDLIQGNFFSQMMRLDPGEFA